MRQEGFDYAALNRDGDTVLHVLTTLSWRKEFLDLVSDRCVDVNITNKVRLR